MTPCIIREFVRVTTSGFAFVDPDQINDEHSCPECGGPFCMTREDALRVADDLRSMADGLITDEQATLADAVEVGLKALSGPKRVPLTITGFPTFDREPPYVIAEIEFGSKEDR